MIETSIGVLASVSFRVELDRPSDMDRWGAEQGPPRRVGVGGIGLRVEGARKPVVGVTGSLAGGGLNVWGGGSATETSCWCHRHGAVDSCLLG